LPSVADALGLKATIALIQALVPTATTERLGQSLEALGPCNGSLHARSRSLSEWVEGWLAKMQRSPVAGPFQPDDPDFRLLIGGDLSTAGKVYRNCLRDCVGYVAVGQRLYYEWMGSPGCGVIVELHCLRGESERLSYATGQIKAVGNSSPPLNVLSAIRARLREAGVLVRGGMRPLGGVGRFLDVEEDEEDDDAFPGAFAGLNAMLDALAEGA
jgi:hypothetical protein